MQKHIFSLLFFILFAQYSFAQNQEIVKKDRPNLILFMLNVSSNKLAAMKERGYDEAQLNVIKTEDEQINSSIIKDFKFNFNYCPVYFFYSTDYDAVKTKDWEKVTFFDAEHLNSKKQIEMKSLDNYYIAEVNYPPAPKYENTVGDIDPRRTDYNRVVTPSYANARDYCVLLYHDDFSIVKGKMGVTNVSLRKVGTIFKPSERSYRFIGAQDFERMLKKYFTD